MSRCPSTHDKACALTVDYGVAYFTLETREEVQILDRIRTHALFEGDFTRGLYQRYKLEPFRHCWTQRLLSELSMGELIEE